MLNAGKALASILSALQPGERLPFLRYVTRKGEWAGNPMFFEEIAACCDSIAAEEARRALAAPTAAAGSRLTRADAACGGPSADQKSPYPGRTRPGGLECGVR